MRRAALLALLAAPLAGCAADAPEPTYGFSGTFDPDASDAARQEVLRRLVAEGAEVGTTDDLPTSRFGATGLPRDRCDAMQGWATDHPAVAQTSPCVPDASRQGQ